MNIGENIKRIRKEKGMTQKELGEKLGVSQSAIGQFENTSSNLKIDTIKKIAEALDVNYTRLVIETPFCTGSKEERLKMTNEQLADYLVYLTTNNPKIKQEIQARVDSTKANTTYTLETNFDGDDCAKEDLDKTFYKMYIVETQERKFYLERIINILERLNEDGMEYLLDYANTLTKDEDLMSIFYDNPTLKDLIDQKSHRKDK